MDHILMPAAALADNQAYVQFISVPCKVAGLFLLIYPCLANAGEIDAIAHINRLLLTKPYVTYLRTETKPLYVPAFNQTFQVTTQVPYQDAARAANSYVAEVSTLAFDKAKLATLPEIALFTQKKLLNCGDSNLTSSVSLTLNGTRSWSISKTDGTSTTTSASATGSLAVPGVGSAGITLGWNQAVTTSTTKQEGFQDTTTRSMTDSVSLGPKKAVNVSLLAYQSTIELPFSATVVIDGDLVGSQGGPTKASALLSKAERTVPLRGTLRITDVSDATVRTDDLSGQAGCAGQEGKLLVEGGNQARFRSAAKGNALRSGFTSLDKAPRIGKALQPKPRWTTGLMSAAGPEMGPPDQTSYSILYTTETAKPTPACGFNDLGLMNTGIFTVEARQYHTYLKGTLIDQHEEFVEIFKNCFTP